MTLDEELKAAGLLTVKELMAGQPMDGFIAHSGVTNLRAFSTWLDMRTEEMLKIRARMELNKEDETELFEWVLSHCAAFNEVRINLKKALANT